MKKIIAVILSLLAAAAAFAQISVQVPSAVALDEQFNLTFMVEGNKPSSFDWQCPADFQLVWGPQIGSSSSISIVNGKTNRSLVDIVGSVIVVSQFTLYADTSHGRRPGFSHAARPELAEPLYERVVANLRARLGSERVGTGRFGAEMKVRLLNDGPFSVELLG